MLVRPFDSTDIPFISSWMEQRGMELDHENDIPDIGFTACINDLPISCIFLRVFENIGFVEGMCTDPEVSSEYRNISMNELIDHVIKEAKNVGIKSLIGFSIDEKIIERASKFGFRRMPQTFFSMKLGD